MIDTEGDKRMEAKIDGTAKNIALMRNEVAMKSFLHKLAAVAEMHVIGEPRVMPYSWPGSADGSALSAHCFLAESSIDIHCYPEKKYVFVDIFSCKDFNEDRVMTCVAKSFNMPKPHKLVLNRGIDQRTGKCIPANVRAID